MIFLFTAVGSVVYAEPSLIDAIYQYDVQKVTFYLNSGMDPDITNAVGTPAIILAAFSDRIVELFLKAGANIEAMDSSGRTVLTTAAENDYPDTVRLLLKRGADPNGGTYSSPIIAAVERGSAEIVRMLIDAGADLTVQADYSVAGVGSGKMGILGVALSSQFFNKDIITMLIEAGAMKSVLNDSDVLVRDRPTTEGSNIIGILNRGDEVTIIGRSLEHVKIGEMSDYWLKIKLNNGTVGYSYGHFYDYSMGTIRYVPIY